MTKQQDIRRNYQSDFSYIEQFGTLNADGVFTIVPIPDDSVDFVLEFWADRGVKFRASRTGGVYDYCEKIDQTNLRVYIPLSRVHLGCGQLCKKLILRYPGNFYHGEDERVVVPRKMGITLFDGPSDDAEISTEQESLLPPTIRGKDGLSANYILQASKLNTKGNSTFRLFTLIENINDQDLEQLANPESYRLVLMRFRKHQSEGRRWRIPMLPYEHVKNHPGKEVKSSIAEEDTWWPVTGRKVEWWGGARTLTDVLPLGVAMQRNQRPCFRNIRNPKMRIGVALFKKTGHGGEGWTRVSNIAEVELFLCKNGNVYFVNIN